MFDEYIAFHARSRPDAPAVVIGEREISFAQLNADVDRAATALSVLTVAGETVSVAVREEYLRWVAVLALARAGAASAPASERSARFRVSDQAADAEDAGTVHLSAERILQDAAARFVPVRPNPDALGRLMHTSGTTGAEKRIALSWRAIDHSIRNVGIIYGAPLGRWLPVTGLGTVLGLTLTLGAWAAGQAVILGSGGMVTPALLALRPTLVGLVPDQLRRLLQTLPADFAPMPELRIIVGGGAVPPALAREARSRLSPDLRSVYGTSETGAAAIAEGTLLEEQARAAGYAIPGTRIEIVGAEGREAAAGEQGRVRIRNDRAVTFYVDDPDATAEAFGEGWFYPGDLGRMRDDGLLLIDGRSDDLMNFGGHKVLPARLEEAVATCAGVREAAAFAVADARGIDRCWLAIVTSEGFDPAALIGAIRRALPRPPPIRWVVVSELPRNAMGKVQRDRLRALVAALPEDGAMPA